MVTAVSLAGYRYISLRLLPVTPHEPRYDILGDTPMRRDLQHRLDDTGIKVVDVEFIRLDADAIVTDFLPLMETAALLQAKQLLVAGYDSDEARFVARLGELCDPRARWRSTSGPSSGRGARLKRRASFGRGSTTTTTPRQ